MPIPRSAFQPAVRPFMTLPRVASFHASRDAQATLDGLHRVITRAEGIGLVIGSTGTGKSLLLTCLRDRLDDRFAVALLSGARICTRRGLWQSILAGVSEPYCGLDEEELRIGLVDRIRGLAATGGSLVVLVDEAHTLPRRLLEELRLLASVVTTQPAVHLVLAGTVRLEEMLGEADLEGIAQRVAVRGYLEPLDYEETCQYLRTQMRVAGLDWDNRFDAETDAAVFTLTDGVPRLINQVCDQALRIAEQHGRRRVGKAELAAAWEEIQHLPPPAALQSAWNGSALDAVEPSAGTKKFLPESPAAAVDGFCQSEDEKDFEDFGEEVGATIIEFGTLDDAEEDKPDRTHAEFDDVNIESEAQHQHVTELCNDIECMENEAIEEGEEQSNTAFSSKWPEDLISNADEEHAIDFTASRRATEFAARALLKEAGGVIDNASDDEVMMRVQTRSQVSHSGQMVDDIELIFDPPFAEEDGVSRHDPFTEIFADEEKVIERFVMEGPDDFHNRLHVASREGEALARQLPGSEPVATTVLDQPNGKEQPGVIDQRSVIPEPALAAESEVTTGELVEETYDDSDMVLIEENLHADPGGSDQSVRAVRLGDYSRLFARLRRGDRGQSSRQA